MSALDVVYPYRETYRDRDLRYSLRSLCNVPHGDVIVAGDKPRGFSVRHVRAEGMRNRYMSSTANILAGAKEAKSDRIVVMHDDIFLMRPWQFVHQDRGSLRDYLAAGAARGSYNSMLERTLGLLRANGIAEPLFYALHTPTVYEVEKLIALIERFGREAVSIRTIYWNIHRQPSEMADDVKIRKMSRAVERMPIISTSDELSRASKWRRWIDRKFPRPSLYEIT